MLINGNKNKLFFNLAKDNPTTNDLVGSLATSRKQWIDSGLPFPEGFAISAKAFDMFVEENKLADEILSALDSISNDAGTISAVASRLHDRFKQTKIPKKVIEELEHQYEVLGTGVGVSLSISPLNDQLNPLNYTDVEESSRYSKGKEAILSSLKELWLELFSAQSLSYRESIRYEGSLSQPVVVQKIINAEVSGSVYGCNIETKNRGQYSVVANLGDPNLELSYSGSDFYLCQKQGGGLVVAAHQLQRKMFVQQFVAGERKYSQVNISTQWDERPKLSESQIGGLYRIVSQIETTVNEMYKFDWVYCAGQFFVTDISLDTKLVEKFHKFSWPKLEPKKLETNTYETSKQDLLNFIRKEESELKLSPSERDAKADTVRNMLPEIKTATEIWQAPSISASEAKVLLQNIDGMGVFTFPEICRILGHGATEYLNLPKSQKLVKEVSDYLAMYLIAVSPKPILIAIAADLPLDFQLQILSQLRGVYGHKNFNCILPELTSLEDIAKYKRQLFTAGFRRTSNFKLLQMISQPIYLYEMGTIMDQGVDGFIVSFSQLYKNMFGGNVTDSNQGLTKFVQWLLKAVKDNNNNFYVLLDTVGYHEQLKNQISEILNMSVSGLIYADTDLYDFKQLLAEQEGRQLTENLKIARKKLRKL